MTNRVLSIAALAAAAACSDREAADCPPGTLGCACFGAGGCEEGLVCRRGECAERYGEGKGESESESEPAGGRIVTMVTSEVRLPSDDEPIECDVDGDGRSENAYGGALRTLAGGLGGEIVPVRTAVQLWGLDADRDRDVFTDPAAVLQTWIGADGDDDPDNNLTGDALLAVASDSPLDLAADGAIERGEGEFGPAPLPYPLVIEGEVRVLGMAAVRVRGRFGTDATIEDAVFCGGIPADVWDRVMIPAIADLLDGACEDPPSEACDTLLAVFDEDGDGHIDDDEVRDSNLLRTTFRPDLDLFVGDPAARRSGQDCVWTVTDTGQRMVKDPACLDAISFGVGFSAVGARFAIPER